MNVCRKMDEVEQTLRLGERFGDKAGLEIHSISLQIVTVSPLMAAHRGTGGAAVKQPKSCPQGGHSHVEGCNQLLLRLMTEGEDGP